MKTQCHYCIYSFWMMDFRLLESSSLSLSLPPPFSCNIFLFCCVLYFCLNLVLLVFLCRYDYYSFSIIPAVGELVAGDRDSYQYLVESIRRFPSQVLILLSSKIQSTITDVCLKFSSVVSRQLLPSDGKMRQCNSQVLCSKYKLKHRFLFFNQLLL